MSGSSVSAGVLRELRGVIIDVQREVVFKTIEKTPKHYFLHGTDDFSESMIRKMKAGEAYRIVAIDPLLRDFHSIHLTKVVQVLLPFHDVDVEEPNPYDPGSWPKFSLNDPKLGERALVYRHLLATQAWGQQFQRRGGLPEILTIMRKLVLLNALYVTYPYYPHASDDFAREGFLNVAAAAWAYGGEANLRLIQEVMEDALDVRIEAEAEPVHLQTRPRLKPACDLLLERLDDPSAGAPHPWALRSDLLLHLRKMADVLHARAG